MTTPAFDHNEDSKMKKLTSGNVGDAIHARLPRAHGAPVPQARAAAPAPSRPRPVPVASAPQTRERRFKFLPAFWTIASLLSITVNIVLIVILLMMWQLLGGIQTAAGDRAAGLLGGLYTNFVKMDQATISSTIPVDAVIPLNIIVPVQTTTRITLAESVVIPNAHVRITTGAMNINADAVVTLPANTPLMVTLDFPLNVQNNIPIHLDVPVNIPLNQTQLHEPFVGLQKVVEPWYCIVEPNATVNGLQVCSPITNPAPAETVIP